MPWKRAFKGDDMREIILVTMLVGSTSPALADAVKIKPIIDARLRYESVDQKPFAQDASAVTARVRAGFEAKTGDFTLLAEAEGILAIDEGYNSGINGKAAFPIVADPQTIGLNRLQLQYRGLPKTVVTVGRQRINLDDQRFVGNVGWRQNEQTFDAARVEWSGVKNLKVDLTYAWKVRTIWGVDGTPTRPESVSGSNIFGNASLTTKVGALTAFGYAVDQDQTPLFANSSITYGGRFAGAHPFNKMTKLSYMLSVARQNDYGRNPNRYTAKYYAGDLSLGIKALIIGVGFEILGADKGVALTSFQTPLATLHKFNGWADKFLVTPPNGLRDAYGSLGYSWKKTGKIDAINLTAAYHRFSSDRLGLRYGDEVNLQATAKVKRYTFLLKYADYSAKGFATDTKKFWASIEWAL
jgi:Alginate export